VTFTSELKTDPRDLGHLLYSVLSGVTIEAEAGMKIHGHLVSAEAR